MKVALFAGLLLWTCSAVAQDTNPILGNWTLNKEESTSPYTLPQMEVRQYREDADGYVTGLAVWVDVQGNPGFLQFTAKSDGNFYPEYDSRTLSALQATGQQSSTSYLEKFIDANTIAWADQEGGNVTARGTKTFSEDRRKMFILVKSSSSDTGHTLVYDKQ